VHTCIRPSCCHCHSLSLASVKSRLVLPFWDQPTWVVPDKGPINGCVCVCVAEFECRWFQIVVVDKVIPTMAWLNAQHKVSLLTCTQPHPAHRVARGQASYFGSWWGPKPGAQRPTAGVRFGEGEASSVPPATRSGGALQAPPEGSRAEPRLVKVFFAFQRHQTASPKSC